MVLMTAQTTSFFDHSSQMAITNKAVLERVNKGIITVDDLSKSDKEKIGQIVYNHRRG